jgi:hypothetical protein
MFGAAIGRMKKLRFFDKYIAVHTHSTLYTALNESLSLVIWTGFALDIKWVPDPEV